MNDLQSMLRELESRVAGSAQGQPEFSHSRARRTVKRKRTTRAVGVSAASAVGVGAIAMGAWSLTESDGTDHTPAVSSSPTESPSSASAPSSASPSPSAEPDEPETEGASLMDLLQNPTTGEVWHEPIPIDNLGLLARDDLTIGGEDNGQYFEIGSRGDATIVAVLPPATDVYGDGYQLRAVFEIDDEGARQITCPSTRSSDLCVFDAAADGTALFTVDPTVHYDSLTYPRRLNPLPGWMVSISPTPEYGDGILLWNFLVYGVGNDWPTVDRGRAGAHYPGDDTRIDVLALGQSALVEYRSPGEVPGLTESRLVIETPYGGLLGSHTNFASDYYGQDAVTWNDNVVTFSHPPAWEGEEGISRVVPATLACSTTNETIADAFDPSEWKVAGTHRLGFDVYLPARTQNAIAEAVFETMRDNSSGGTIDGVSLEYPYAAYDDFLAARSVFAWERPDGQWVIAMDDYARQRLYECS